MRPYVPFAPSHPAGEDYLAEICKEWEGAANVSTKLSSRATYPIQRSHPAQNGILQIQVLLQDE